MKKKIFVLSILAVSFLIITAKIGLDRSSEWKERSKLGRIRTVIRSEEVVGIIFCETTAEDIDDWFVRFEVPKEAICKSLYLMDKALTETDARRRIWDIKRVKIITEKEKYIVPVNWTDDRIYGSDWVSYELREYLREYGFVDP